MRNKIVVIGSINMDLVCRTPRLPRRGETVLGGEFMTVPGGKGANQAVAAAKLARAETSVHFVGKLGDDVLGEQLLAGLRGHAINTDHVSICSHTASGIAMILVDQRGENCIAVSSGANAKVMPDDVDRAVDLIRSAVCVILQLEIPIATVVHACQLCRKLGVYTILDAAPAPSNGLPAAAYEVDLFTPNETEAAALLNEPVLEPAQVGRMFIAKGAKSVVLKQGGRGATSVTAGGEAFHADQFSVEVVDSTAAGDAFTGALAVARAEGISPRESLQFANAAGALCCTVAGAQPSLPKRDAVDQLLSTSANASEDASRPDPINLGRHGSAVLDEP